MAKQARATVIKQPYKKSLILSEPNREFVFCIPKGIYPSFIAAIAAFLIFYRTIISTRLLRGSATPFFVGISGLPSP